MAQLSGDDFGNLIYLVLLGGVIAFWFSHLRVGL